LLALVVVVSGVAAAAQGRFDTATSRRLEASALHGRAFEYVADLTRSVGSRLTGSPSYDRAALWAIEQFKAAGVGRVAAESFTIAHGWSREERGRGRITAPVDRPLSIESFGWAPSLPSDGIEAEVILAGPDLASDPERARDRIVLVAGSLRLDQDRRLKAAGALALVFAGSGADNDLPARLREFGGEIAELPTALLTADSAQLIRDLLRQGPVRIQLAYRNRVSDGPVGVPNVVGEIPGRERPDEFVVVGAHLDSWDFATGAQDNGTGVAMVLEAARSIAALGRPPRRSVRFALWGGEEQGLLGSSAYVAAHAAELEHCVAVLNADGGTGRIIGWTTPGRDDVMMAVRAVSRVLLSDLRTDAVDKNMQYAFDSDGGPFIREGIPALDMNVDDGPYDAIHHKVTDTLERVDERNLAKGAAMVAITAYAIADASQRIAARGPRLR
jgi:carboxypeptidase Q